MKWKRASELQQYEKAKEIRDTLHRLNNLAYQAENGKGGKS